MSYLNRILKLIISIESIIISSLIQINIPLANNLYNLDALQVNWQIPVIILLTIIFSGELIFKAYSLYIFIGLFLLPVFFDGGSLGYLLTPNFGYLIGIFPLISIVSILNKKNNISFIKYIRYSLTGLIIMHFTGIFYLIFQLLIFNKENLIFYNIGLFTLNKIPFQMITLIPVYLIFSLINKLNN